MCVCVCGHKETLGPAVTVFVQLSHIIVEKPVFEVEVKVVLLGLDQLEGWNRNKEKVISCVRPVSFIRSRWIG